MNVCREPSRRVLLAEDDTIVRRSFVRFLRTEGYEVDAVTNGVEACKRLELERFDVVLSDLSMPGMSGIQFLRALRELDTDLPVILVTGEPSVASAAEAVGLGALRYLVKPVEPEALREALSYASHVHQLARLKREAMLYSLDQTVENGGEIEACFERAIDGVYALYQPIVSNADRRVSAHEALVRSIEPTFARPFELLQTAEALDRLRDLGRAIRARVARDLDEMPGTDLVFVNLHPADLRDDTLFGRGDESPLTRHADRIVLEITERSRVDDIDNLDERIRRLRALGFRFAVDDLGAGYAGLTSFLSLQPEIVKIDMSLVRGVEEDRTKQRLLGSLSRLCYGMGIQVVAEGVETAAERARILELGVDLHQGYYYGRPAEAFTRIGEDAALWAEHTPA